MSNEKIVRTVVRELMIEIKNKVLTQREHTQETLELDFKKVVYVNGAKIIGIVKRDKIMENFIRKTLKIPIDYYLYLGFTLESGRNVIDLFTMEIQATVKTTLTSNKSKLVMISGKEDLAAYDGFLSSVSEELNPF